jgi:SNF2 family DNA or RNA helicase
MIEHNTKLRAGKFMIPVTLLIADDRIFFKFKYNKILKDEIKNMQGCRWHGFDEANPQKIWSVTNSPRNRFQISYLEGKNPYARYDQPLIEVTPKRSLYEHQRLMVSHILTVKHCIEAAEMGTGKTLAGIEVMEQSGHTDWWWIGPKSALKSVELELIKWQASVRPRLLTYEGLKSVLSAWQNGTPPPHGVVFDESSRIKNPTAQRSEAALHLANAIRGAWEDSGYIVLLSGSPAPKSPVDWWHQAEVACPGFLKEGDQFLFKKTLAIIEERESITGGVYPHLVTWRNNPKLCNICGQELMSEIHLSSDGHTFEPSVDEVARLGKRMRGLVQVIFKKDCLDLPDKIYRIVRVDPTPSILRAASLIATKTPRAAQCLILLRELSDGFQYQETVVGKEVCELCHGKRTYTINEQTETCPNCKGTGEQVKKERTIAEVDSPKERALIDLLDEHSEVGRAVIYAGFQGSIERIMKICRRFHWAYIKMDGRGIECVDCDGHPFPDDKKLLQAMDASHPDKELLEKQFPRLAFIGQPGSGGMGLTLTASPSIIYFSNDFNAESRIQSEDRIHRVGMDTNRGATIIDILHLPTDEYVLNNLKKKRDLQKQSIDDIRSLFKGIDHEQVRTV